LIVIDELQEEAEAQLRLNLAIDNNFPTLPSEGDADNLNDGFIFTLLSAFTHTPIQTLDLSGFTQINLIHVEATLQEHNVVFDVIPYGISHTPPAFLNIIKTSSS